MSIFPEVVHVSAVGIGATLVMDGWLMLLRWCGIPVTNFAWLGRWVGHLFRGSLAHSAIARSAPVLGERVLGWLTHYLVGVAFAHLFVAIAGVGWLTSPSLSLALLFGLMTVVAPLFIIQPVMGAGFAGRHTPSPARNVVRSLTNHVVFGLGLYLAAWLLSGLAVVSVVPY
jgi:hypothetical protein